MAVFVSPDDLRASLPDMSDMELRQVADEAEALAAAYAPCMFSDSFDQFDPVNSQKVAQLKAILRRAIAYDAATGSGVVSSESVSAGDFSKNRQFDVGGRVSGMLFSPAQIEVLRSLCKPTIRAQGAYSVSLGMPGF